MRSGSTRRRPARVHGRRPRLEGRRPRRAALDTTASAGSAGARRARRAKRSGSRCASCSTMRAGRAGRASTARGLPRPRRCPPPAPVVDGVPRSIRTTASSSSCPASSEPARRFERPASSLVVVTNQPEIARGTHEPKPVERINARLARPCGSTTIVVCPHDDADDCDCRKPRPGMLARRRGGIGLDLAASFMVGDRWRDVEAGRRAGCRIVFVDRNYSEPVPRAPDARVRSSGRSGRLDSRSGHEPA